MRIFIGAVGRLKDGPLRELCQDYVRRLGAQGPSVGIRSVSIQEIPESNRRNGDERRGEEAAGLLAAVPDGAYVFALDERGKAMASREFATKLTDLQSDGTTDVGFLIGGPDGHGDAVRQAAARLMSFGPMTWPHMLVRTMLAEQLYRVVTILAKHPYHRD